MAIFLWTLLPHILVDTDAVSVGDCGSTPANSAEASSAPCAFIVLGG